jgi:DNA-directed RNA polymerase specialized sigma24 family protein
MTQNSLGRDELFEEQYARLVSWCKARLRADVADPEEVVHLAYLRSRKSSVRRSATDVQNTGYLWRLLRWSLWDVLRVHQRRQRCVQLGLIETAGRPTPCPWREAAANEALLRLSKREQAVCLLLLSGISVDESCKRLKLRRGAASVTLCRARRKLVRILEIRRT